MTATQSARFGLPQSAFALLRRVGLFASRSALALVILFMAGIIAVATAAAGMALAIVALLMRLFGAPYTGGPAATERPDGDGLTLDARKTPRGWTVE